MNKAIRDAGLEGKRRTNAIDATGALVPKSGHHHARDRSAVVPPDPARAPTAKTSKYWGVTWNKRVRRWKAEYTDANCKTRYIGLFDTQEAAAHAVNAAIRRAGLEGRRHLNAVDATGALVPRERTRKAPKRPVEVASESLPLAQRKPKRKKSNNSSAEGAAGD